MRFTIIKVILITLFLSPASYALDLSAYEGQCTDIGFKRKTPAFGECVLELRSRQNTNPSSSENSIVQGDGSPDHSTCAKYGFRAGSTEYGQCRMQVDLARSQAQEQQRQYESQVADQQKARDRAKGEAALLMGLSMMAGGGRQPLNNSLSRIEPPQMNRIYNLPGGKSMTCSTFGMVTNCN